MTRVDSLKPSGFVERSNGTVLEELLTPKMRETFYDTVEALQTDLDALLNQYNRGRSHLGYRSQGRSPWETVQRFVTQEG